ncbi:TPA_asm: hypothetical protein GNB58_005107 [Salmonella enterica subsp. houtenae serovar 45:g,z51:-]|uniref:Uncharacterized protein n=1 Tax=Salmonella enterica subsp. houtenae serovar 45:g,z51:- TaxID=1967611 RepID=A0A736R8J9_SALHO|nr:hypothetical protein [Salmonella enterica subsp. houtenae str. CFSAN000557]HAE7767960.1 hypothetical protein [Salmonella enterica subsp. houtenae serovar 45:g,z51:-]HEM7399245.1 hypothetical protein [Citrobacter farmeri]
MIHTVKNQTNASMISALVRAEALIMYLSAQGVSIKSVSLRHAQPVIRIERSAWCERMKAQGLARFDHFGHDRFGRFRQGIWTDESGCRVVWSESVH